MSARVPSGVRAKHLVLCELSPAGSQPHANVVTSHTRVEVVVKHVVYGVERDAAGEFTHAETRLFSTCGWQFSLSFSQAQPLLGVDTPSIALPLTSHRPYRLMGSSTNRKMKQP